MTVLQVDTMNNIYDSYTYLQVLNLKDNSNESGDQGFSYLGSPQPKICLSLPHKIFIPPRRTK